MSPTAVIRASSRLWALRRGARRWRRSSSRSGGRFGCCRWCRGRFRCRCGRCRCGRGGGCRGRPRGWSHRRLGGCCGRGWCRRRGAGLAGRCRSSGADEPWRRCGAGCRSTGLSRGDAEYRCSGSGRICSGRHCCGGGVDGAPGNRGHRAVGGNDKGRGCSCRCRRGWLGRSPCRWVGRHDGHKPEHRCRRQTGSDDPARFGDVDLLLFRGSWLGGFLSHVEVLSRLALRWAAAQGRVWGPNEEQLAAG